MAAGHEILTSGRAVTAQTPGGTGALRVAADLLKKHFPAAKVWVSKPTWANHPAIFSAAGISGARIAYIDAAGQGLDFAAMLAALQADSRRRHRPAARLLPQSHRHRPHAGAMESKSPKSWHERKLLPLVDFAYQGFGDGLAEDAVGLRELSKLDRNFSSAVRSRRTLACMASGSAL